MGKIKDDEKKYAKFNENEKNQMIELIRQNIHKSLSVAEKDTAWDKICSIMNVPGRLLNEYIYVLRLFRIIRIFSVLSAHVCKSRWRSIRDNYKRKLREGKPLKVKYNILKFLNEDHFARNEERTDNHDTTGTKSTSSISPHPSPPAISPNFERENQPIAPIVQASFISDDLEISSNETYQPVLISNLSDPSSVTHTYIQERIVANPTSTYIHDDGLDAYLSGIGRTIRTFPIDKQATVKLKIAEIVFNMEKENAKMSNNSNNDNNGNVNPSETESSMHVTPSKALSSIDLDVCSGPIFHLEYLNED